MSRSQSSFNSRASRLSQKLFDDVSQKSQTYLFQLQQNLNGDMIQAAWTAFGKYIKKQLRLGRAVHVPKLGVFTFTTPSVNLMGVTNPQVRDKQPRDPVFLLSKNFIKGKNISCGLSTDLGIRTFYLSGLNGNIQYIKCNFTEVALSCGMDKDTARGGCERVFGELAEHVTKNDYGSVEIPEVGTLEIRNNIAAVSFLESLKFQIKTVLTQSISERFEKLASNLTASNLKRLDEKEEDDLLIDESAKTWLNNNLNINVNDIFNSKTEIRKESSELPEIIRPMPKDMLVETLSQKNYIQKSSIKPKRDANEIKNSSTAQAGFRKIKEFLRFKVIKTNDAFFELATAVLGKKTNVGCKLNKEEFHKACDKCEIYLSGVEVDSIFEVMDKNKDGFIDVKEWNESIIEDIDSLQTIRETIKKNHIVSDDLLKKMGISREQGALNEVQIRNGIKKMMNHISEEGLNKAVSIILPKGQTSLLPVSKLLEIFECAEDYDAFDDNWLNVRIRKIGSSLHSKLSSDRLSVEFEKFDKNNQGRLDIANFKTCLFKAKVDLDFDEITRICRYIEKDRDSMIDYVAFLRRIGREGGEGGGGDGLEGFANGIINQIKLSQKSIHDYFTSLLVENRKNLRLNDSMKASIFDFKRILENSVFFGKISKIVEFMDIDQDGYIDVHDFEIFLKRYNYIEDNIKKGRAATLPAKKLFPTKPLSESKYEEVLRDFKRGMREKKISFYDVFHILDQNEDGFITISEFVEGIDKIVRLSQTIKEGFFAYLDVLKIGMIDYPHFLMVIKKPINSKKVTINDSFDWQSLIISKLHSYFASEKLSPADAFRIVDSDFDGFISKSDLKKFLITVLNVRAEEANSSNIDRLFKLLDRFKRGCITKEDFAHFFEGKGEGWIESAKQQVGLVLSKSFGSLKESFEKISRHSNSMNYNNFVQWIEKNQAIQGFNLTENLIQEFFASLDPHKKGYLSENDWQNAFKNFNWNDQKLSELRTSLQFNFNDAQSAYRYFKKNANNKIELSDFIHGVNGLLPNRFTSKEIKNIFNAINGGENSLEFCSFEKELFDKNNTTSSFKSTLKTTTSTNIFPSSLPPFSLLSLLSKRILSSSAPLASPNPNSDLISQLEFKNYLKSLKLGLSGTDIDELVKINVNFEGMVNMKDFLRRVRMKGGEVRIKERTKGRMRKVREGVVDFFLSPKDAFRQFNENNSGKMTFEEFVKFINALSQRSNEVPPSYDIIKDLFVFIDLREDGFLDIHEWMQSFRQIDNMDRSMSPEKLTPSIMDSLSEIDHLITLIGRNRKVLASKFEEKIKEKGKILLNDAIEILQNSLEIKLDETGWIELLKFADKPEFFDYKFMIKVFKERVNSMVGHPKDLISVKAC